MKQQNREMLGLHQRTVPPPAEREHDETVK